MDETGNGPKKSLPRELKRLSDTGTAGDYHALLRPGDFSDEEAELACRINEIVRHYRMATDHDLMKYKLANDALGIALWDMEVVSADPMNPNNTFIWSQEFRHMLGFSDERDFPNILSSWSDRLHPEDKERALTAVAAHLNDYSGKTPFNIEYRLRLKNGEYRYFHAFGTTRRNGAGVPLRVAGALMDIDERHHMQNQLMIMSSVVEHSPSFISYQKLNGECLYVNPAAMSITGYTREELIDNYVGSLFDDEMAQSMTAKVTQDLQENGISNFEAKGKHKSGMDRIYAGTSFVVEKDAFATIASDVTEARQTEIERIEAIHMLGALNEMAVMLLSHEENDFADVMSRGLKPVAEIAEVNRIAVYRRSDETGRMGQVYLWYGKTVPLEEDLRVLPDIPPIRRWVEALSKGECLNVNVSDTEEDGAAFLRPIGVKAMFAVPIFTRGEFWGAITLEDHTNYRYFDRNYLDIMQSMAHLCAGAVVRAEMEREVSEKAEKLRDALEQATAASRAKSEFLANMSHEIRTPINAVVGMTNIGKTSSDMEHMMYCFGRIEEASALLLGTINSILDMSKIEAGKFELSELEFHFERTLHRIVNVFHDRIHEKRQKLEVYVDRHIPQTLLGDDQRLSQVITNLIGNAVKFTPEGGRIRIGAYFLKEQDGMCTLQITVADSGIGLSAEQQANLFRPFQQAENSTTRRYGGTGLGLAISKSIVEMMGGQIGVESEPGKGASFSFTAQLKRGGENGLSLMERGIFWDNVRILVVDDDPDVLALFVKITGDTGAVCDTAPSGEAALALAKAGKTYDVCFLDWLLPGIDGIELARKLKERAVSPKDVAIVCISAAPLGSVINDVKPADVDRFLAKPLFPYAIVDAVNDCIGGEDKAQETAEQPAPQFPGRRILLAEDVEINREIVLALLEPTQIEIVCAENGKEAVDLFSCEPERFDMILMDIQMPEMDGYEATRRIRAMDALKAKTVPIVAMTANTFREDVENCLAAGMNGHIGKPLDFDEVLTQIRNWLR